MADDETSRDRLDHLIERVDQLESLLRQQAARLYAMENWLQLPHQVQPPEIARNVNRGEAASHNPRPEAPGDARPVTAFRQSPETQAQNWPSTNENPAAPVTYAPVLNAPPSRTKARTDLEARIGGNWFNRIGIIAVALGVGFFLKYAFDNQWIGPWGRVMIGVAIGLSFLTGGERLRPRYHSYAYGLTGGGILILYLSIFAAFRFELVGPFPAFIFMALVTATASLLAARYNALPIAVLGLIGGFLTPPLLSTGVDNEAGLFGYIALLDLGVLALAYSKQWRSLNYMAFIATVLTFTGWAFTFYESEKLWLTMIFLTLFFSVFALLAVLYNVVNRRLTRWLDLILVFSNALLYFGASYLLLGSRYEPYLGLFAVIVSAFYLVLGYVTYERDREDRLLLYTFLGLATLFAVLAVPIQFKQHWVTMGWAIEGAILTWVGLRVGDKTSRYSALAVFMIAVTHWLGFDFSNVDYSAFKLFTNPRALSGAVLVTALALAAWFYRRYGDSVEKDERATFGGILVLGANALAVLALSFDLNDYFEREIHSQRANGGALIAQLDSAKQLTLSAMWTIYGATAFFAGVARNLKLLRIAALALFAITALKVVSFDLRYYDSLSQSPVFNKTFAAFALLIAALALCARLYARSKDIDETERAILSPLTLVAANLLAVFALSLEAIGYFERQISGGQSDASDLRLAQQLSLSLIWTVYGGAMLTVGIVKRSRLLRMMALLLLGLTILKVFLLDLSSLDRIYRIISFIALGGILLAVSFLYQRYRQRVFGLDDEQDAEAQVGLK